MKEKISRRSPNFSEGPYSVYYVNQSLPETFDAEKAVYELTQWKQVLSDEDFKNLEEITEKFLKNEKFGDVRYFFYGITDTAPTTSTGYGGYYYWESLESCYVDINENQQATFDENGEIIDFYVLDIRIALKAKPEKEKDQK